MELMKKLPGLDKSLGEKMEKTRLNYQRFLGLKTEILEFDNKVITVKIEQTRKLTDTVFTRKELIQKANEIFSHLPVGYKVRIRPLVFKGEGMDAISPAWVRNQMKKKWFDSNRFS
jgi:hypothetical protein